MEKETKVNKKTTSTKKTASKKTNDQKSKASSKGSKTAKVAAPATKTSSKNAQKKSVKKETAKKVNNKPSEKVSSKKNALQKETKDIVKVEEVKEPKKKVVETEKKEATKELTLGEEFKKFIKSDIGSLIGIILIIVVVMTGFFFITDFIKKLNKVDEELVMENDIQYDEILISNILKQPNGTYYVLMYDKGDESYDSNDIYVETFNLYLNTYKGKENALRVYTVDLSQKFNEIYVTEEDSNLLVTNINDFKVKTTTLIKVENNKVVSAYETPNSIIEHLSSLATSK